MEIGGLYRGPFEVLAGMTELFGMGKLVPAEQLLQQNQSGLPFLTTDTLLRAFHIMRC